VRTEFSKRVALNCLFNRPKYYRQFCLNGPNNRGIRQSKLSASERGFEIGNSRIQSRVYTLILVRIFV